MIYEAVDIWNSPSFEHYGVKGMKWGIRKEIRSFGRKRRSKSTANKKRNYKKILKYGAIATGVVLAGVGAYYLYKTGRFKEIADVGKKSLGAVSNIAIPKDKKVLSTASDISKAIKPQEKLCNFNSFAASLAGSGNFDISLKPDAGSKYVSNVNDLMSKALKNPDDRIFDTIPENIFRNEFKLQNTIMRITKGKEGACGQISSSFKKDSTKGHAFNWKIENGAVKFFDTYAHSLKNGYGPKEDASNYMYGVISGVNGKITRLDGLTKDDLNLDFLKQIYNIKPR